MVLLPVELPPFIGDQIRTALQNIWTNLQTLDAGSGPGSMTGTQIVAALDAHFGNTTWQTHPSLAGLQPLDSDISALAALTGTGLFYRSAPDTWSPVTIGANLSFSAGTLSASGSGGPSVAPFRGTYTPGSIVVLIGDSNSNGREPGSGSPGGRPDFQIAFNRELADGNNALYSGCTIHNIAGNGSQIAGWVQSITTGNQLTNTSTDPASVVNVWAAKNILAAAPTKKGIIHVKLGTNEQWNSAFRSTGGVGVEATQLANFNTLIGWLIDNTSADLVLVIPQPIAYGRTPAIGDWPNQASADESSRIIRATYLNCTYRDHPRVRLIDTHAGLWGTAITPAGVTDYQTLANLLDNDLHPSGLGYRREQQFVANSVTGGAKVPRMRVPQSPDVALVNSLWSETVYMHNITDTGPVSVADISYDPLFCADGQTVDKPEFWPSPISELAHLKSIRALAQFGVIKRLTSVGSPGFRKMFCWCHNSNNVYSLGRMVVNASVVVTPGYWYAQMTPEYQRDYAGVSGSAKFVTADIGPVTFWVEDAGQLPVISKPRMKTEFPLFLGEDATVALPVSGIPRQLKIWDACTLDFRGYAQVAPSGGTCGLTIYRNGTARGSLSFADGGAVATSTIAPYEEYAVNDLVQVLCTTNTGSAKGVQVGVLMDKII